MKLFRVLILIYIISVKSTHVKWCKYRYELLCVGLDDECSSNFEWSLSSDEIELPQVNDNFSVKCFKETELTLSINFKVKQTLFFTLENTFYKFLKIKNYFENITNLFKKNSHNSSQSFNNNKNSNNTKETLKGSCTNCAICSGTTCTKCNDGYYLSSGSCSSCSYRCVTCFGSSYTQCYSCKNGYYLKDPNYCYSCSSPCNYCTTATSCVTCNQYYYLSGTSCLSCYSSCSYCSGPNSNQCTSCRLHYYYSSGSCIACHSSCNTCSSYSSSSCKTCYSKYYLSNSQCYACSADCYNCNGPTRLNCTSCNSHYYLSNKECFLCHSECYSCDGPYRTNCTSCYNGYYFYYSSTYNRTCIPCMDGCAHCPDSTYCFECSMGYFRYDYNICLKCSEGCLDCREMDYCYQCVNGYYSYYNNTGSYCKKCAPECLTCYGPNNNTCYSCAEKYYLQSNKCLQCDSTCYNCTGLATNCTSCVEGERYYFNGVCNICENCKTGKCYSYPIMCSQCDDGYYSLNGICVLCHSNCLTCDTQSTNCTSCYDGTYLYDNKCLPCDTSCTTNYCDTFNGCTLCKPNYFPKNKTCHLCNEINNCNTCSQLSEICTKCNGEFLTQNGKCVCPAHKYQSEISKCDYCYNKIDNCKMCTYSGDKVTCLECYPPYMASNGICILCNDYYYYNQTTKMCLQDNNGCNTQLDNTKCLKCNDNYYLNKGKCIPQNSKCVSNSKISCEECNNGFSIIGECYSYMQSCKYFNNNNMQSTCFNCDDNYEYNNKCVLQNNVNSYTRNNAKFKCNDNEYVNDNNKCSLCYQYNQNTAKCILSQQTVVSLTCDKNGVINLNSKVCNNYINCIQNEQSDCVKCSEDTNYILKDNSCTKHVIENCVLYNKNVCIKCENNYLINNNVCVRMEQLYCKRSHGVSCEECIPSYYKSNTENSDYCLPSTFREKYLILTSNAIKTIYECQSTYGLYDNSCTLVRTFKLNNQFNKDLKTSNKLVIDEYDKKNQNSYKYMKNDALTDCEIMTTKGCVKCNEKFYLSNNKCLPCKGKCVTCYNSTYCLSCSTDLYFLNVNNECELASDLRSRCQNSMPNDVGCAICKNGYFKDKNDCVKCDPSCATCTEISKCLTCIDNSFLTPSESYLCQSFDGLTNCIDKTKSGCKSCADGYYLNLANNRCYQCNSECQLCTSDVSCTLCKDNYILKNERCENITTVQFCVKALHNYCTQCENNKKLSEDGLSCVDDKKLFLKVGVPILVIFFVIIFGTISVILLQKTKKEEAKVCIFDMKKSNVTFTNISTKICSNKKVLEFTGESDTDIDVNVESRELLCIGNKGKTPIKIQFTVKEGCDQYSIRTEPKLVTLKKNFACEFEVFITPNFSSKIEDEVACVCLDVNEGKEEVILIKIRASTKPSTRLDYHELIEDKKIGEGTFGTVYKGTYRGNLVAIKRMKFSVENCDSTKIGGTANYTNLNNKTNGMNNLNTQQTNSGTATQESTNYNTNDTSKNTTKNNTNFSMTENDEQRFEDFANEVSMLDKFRSEYIVHFYGAVFVPSKICMVTEFAQFGSLHDLMKHKKSDEVDINVRIKILIDSSKGIEYLHTNGILHRDIKPDNILVFSLDITEKVIAKLTDFGSSRNVNLLQTNMTFTKGIGTPTYMAPEILKQEKYKKSADIYSFGVMMYECLGWCNAYPKTFFKFPWKIAEFVTSGKRLEKQDNMPTQLFDIIEKCWKHNQIERITSSKLVCELEKQRIQ
ncbi:protein serine/threonine kinase, putative [Entamoeba invadens IP1]|uniref:Protein serine/threonine kinase, putative n=1 Tax=Entamoeba invadens IP1 TaxID=370355 RepID=A0A0A1U6B8_ENTIV|nr:protein serine/threonine kinase, putative [Entamoeba invadens IP1]ELP89926.1 protein serine/threonine kinase, putative [Entamoeba invadens IP1]|eukprot:XP_004256697.1 protein serine/threonine kinase, putative [Entamoeba invadens IP1]